MNKSIIKICYISLSSESHTGSPKAMLDLVANLNASIYSPFLSVPSDGPLAHQFKCLYDNVSYMESISLNKTNIIRYFNSVRDYRAYFSINKISILHFNGTGWRESAVVAARLARIPVILHLHNPYPEKDIRGNFNFNLADRVIIVSQSMRDNFINHPHILKKIHCIHNGVDLNRFAPVSTSLRSYLSICGDGPVVGFVGQISHRKGVDILIRAAVEILPQYPAALFVIAGADGVGEEGHTEKMKHFAAELGIAERFVFLGKRDDVAEVMNTFDLMVVPSRAEPFGKVIIEAMACGKCVVAAKVGGIPEIIEDGVNGLLVREDDSSSLASAILLLLGDVVLRDNLAQKGLKTAHDQFSIETLVNKTQSVYQELLQKRQEGNERH